MGKSASCLKVLTCGSDSKDKYDIDIAESKGSSDKRGWSFRKRSARHRVLSNSVITETTPSRTKGSPETTSLNFHSPTNSTVLEKTYVRHCTDEKPKLSTPENPEPTNVNFEPPADSYGPEKSSTDEKPSLYTPENPSAIEAVVESTNESKIDVSLVESVIVIQTAVRVIMAQRALLKSKNVIKLQAAVRGHLVRRHAVGTLRCVQAIVKMQALVRARHARLSVEGSNPEKLDGNLEKDKCSYKTLEKEKLSTSNSIDKILKNKFARQLLESTPKNKPINIKCDPSKPDSGWKWLERWMSVSSVDVAKPKEAKIFTKHQESEKVVCQVNTGIESEDFRESVHSRSCTRESVIPSESDENLITYDADNLTFKACDTTSTINNLEQSWSEDKSTSDLKQVTSTVENCVSEQTEQSNLDSQIQLNYLPQEPKMDTEETKPSVKWLASEQLETEGEKFGVGLREVSDPASIACQLNSEEQSTTANSGRLINSSYQDNGAECYIDTVSSAADSESRSKELVAEENFVPPGSRVVQVGGSECGTELSISSTLDSLEASEAGALEDKHKGNVPEEGVQDPSDSTNTDVEIKNLLMIPVSQPVLGLSEKCDVVSELIHPEVDVDSRRIESKSERNLSDLQRNSSPEASPKSYITVPESQATPSSQVSMKAKRNVNDKTVSSQKRKSLSTGKKSPLHANHDSDSRSGELRFSKDKKNAKRRNSFGSPKPEHIEEEPRDSSSSNSLPRFMQATESAKAKANNSQRSGPDVQDRESYVKKRHSLPGANGRQGSPRVQQSLSPAQQAVQGNERKWRR